MPKKYSVATLFAEQKRGSGRPVLTLKEKPKEKKIKDRKAAKWIKIANLKIIKGPILIAGSYLEYAALALDLSGEMNIHL
jgi:hypothetical protein